MDPAVFGAGLRRKLDDVRLVIERQRAFVPGFADDVSPNGAEVGSEATDFVLRMLKAASDSLNYRLLAYLETTDAGFADVCQHLGIGELTAWERVNDLVQAGLVARAPDRDLVGLTAAGLEMVRFVGATVASAEIGHEGAT
ncbi:MAG: hypothetical protein OEM40_00845 [Acidimicrobiia bacterium]|nr:hypothetical protein [Acidimicrobiia bacterium]